MKIFGKITMCDYRKGISQTTGAEWHAATYVIVYDGHFANGTSCQRSFRFDVFGLERLKALGIHKDNLGTLDVETYTRTATSRNGNQYIENVFDVLSWTPDNGESTPTSTPAPVTASASVQSATTPNNAEGDSTDLPF